MFDFGTGVKLARLRKADLPTIFKWRNDPRIYKYTRQNAPLHESSHEEWFHWQAKDPNTEMFGVYVSTADKFNDVHEVFCGVVGLTGVDHVNRRAEFSCYINPDMHGMGLGGKALKALFTYGFKVLGLNLIWGETFDGNPAAKLFEKLGMTLHGTRPNFYFREGKFIDAHLYGVKAEQWSS